MLGGMFVVLACLAVSLLGALALWRAISGLIRLLRSSIVATAPLAPGLTVTLPAGRLIFWGEGPRGSNFSSLRLEVGHPSGGVPLRRTFPVRVGGLAGERRSLFEGELRRAGAYEITSQGAPAGTRLVVSHPVALGMVLHILGIVAASFGVVGGLVLGSLWL